MTSRPLASATHWQYSRLRDPPPITRIVVIGSPVTDSIELTASARILLPGLPEAFAGIQSSVGRLRAHNDTGTLTVTASPSFAAKWLVLRLHRFQAQCPEIDVRISATDDVVDLSKGDFDVAIRYGTGNYPGLAVELLLKNEVFPACSLQLLAAGPLLRTPQDLSAHALIHDQAIERDPLVPTWPMWLKAAGVKDVPGTAGLRFNNIHLALDAAIAGHGVVLAYSAIAAADSPPAGWYGSSPWHCPTSSPTTSSPPRARLSDPR